MDSMNLSVILQEPNNKDVCFDKKIFNCGYLFCY